jgi:hypothetical protein
MTSETIIDTGMRKELDDLLCQHYPEIFRDRHGSEYETGMCWGFTCGDGWFSLIDGLCAEMSSQVEAGKMPPVVATQVKEKLGMLRFHFRGGNEETRRIIEETRQKSERTCEECGQPVESNIGCGPASESPF